MKRGGEEEEEDVIFVLSIAFGNGRVRFSNVELCAHAPLNVFCFWIGCFDKWESATAWCDAGFWGVALYIAYALCKRLS